jgi:hypothetical protein
VIEEVFFQQYYRIGILILLSIGVIILTQLLKRNHMANVARASRPVRIEDPVADPELAKLIGVMENRAQSVRRAKDYDFALSYHKDAVFHLDLLKRGGNVNIEKEPAYVSAQETLSESLELIIRIVSEIEPEDVAAIQKKIDPRYLADPAKFKEFFITERRLLEALPDCSAGHRARFQAMLETHLNRPS